MSPFELRDLPLALAHSALPIPALVAYAETSTGAKSVGWLAMSHIPGRPLLGAVIAASEPQRAVLFRSLGALLRRLHSMPIPPALLDEDDWVSRQIEQARANLGWCDGTAAGLVELERSRPAAVPETLIHGDLALDNLLVDSRGTLGLIDWAGGGPGDPRHDVALALQTRPEAELSAGVLDAFYAGYESTPVAEATRDWFVRLYDYF